METENMEEDLLLRYADGLTDEAETTRVEEWLAASDEHRALLRRVQQLLLAADVAANPARLRVEEALRAVHGRMKRRLWKRIGRVVQRVAAVLFLPALGAALWLYAGLMHDDGRMWEARTNPGMNATVVLPDSSVVVLNSSSVLRYPERFRGDTRQVSLSGEAYFSVQHDPDRRFIVQTPHQGQVEVHGTEFNVDAYPEEDFVRTTLVTGKVDFLYAHSEGCKRLSLQPGERLTYDTKQGKTELKQVNVEVETAWKDGKLTFRKTPFEEILWMLSKRYNIHFILKNDALKQHTFTGEFKGQQLPRVLEQFSLSSDIHFRWVENTDEKEEKQTIEVY